MRESVPWLTLVIFEILVREVGSLIVVCPAPETLVTPPMEMSEPGIPPETFVLPPAYDTGGVH